MARFACFFVAATLTVLATANDATQQLHATHTLYEVPEGLVMDMEPQESGGAGLGGHVVRTVVMLCIFLGILSAFVSPHMSPVESAPMLESASEEAYELDDALVEDDAQVHTAVEGCVSQDEVVVSDVVEVEQAVVVPDVVEVEEEVVVPNVVESSMAPQELSRQQKRAALLEKAALILKDRRTRKYEDIHKRLDASTFAIIPGAKHSPAGFTHLPTDATVEVADSEDATLLSTSSKLSAFAAPYVSPKKAAPKCLLDCTGAPTAEFLRSVPPKAPSSANSMMMCMPLMMMAATGVASTPRKLRRRSKNNKNNRNNKNNTNRPASTDSYNLHKKVDAPILPRAVSLPLTKPIVRPSLPLRAPSAIMPSIWSTSATPRVESKVGRCPPGLVDPFMDQQPLLPSGLLL